MILLAILLPWLSFLIRGKIGAGLLCLILQITVIGWLPAMIWAVMSLNQNKLEKKLTAMEQQIINNRNQHQNVTVNNHIHKEQ